MKLETTTKQQIARNAILSLFIYVLPIALMFITFYFTGQRPWEKQQHKQEQLKSITTKNTSNNGSND
jgi:preprotein translocase subunit YajC